MFTYDRTAICYAIKYQCRNSKLRRNLAKRPLKGPLNIPGKSQPIFSAFGSCRRGAQCSPISAPVNEPARSVKKLDIVSTGGREMSAWSVFSRSRTRVVR